MNPVTPRLNGQSFLRMWSDRSNGAKLRAAGGIVGIIALMLLVIKISAGENAAAQSPPRFTLGPSDAAVEVVEFCDLVQPECQQGHELLSGLLAIQNQKLKISFRHYPLTSIHPRSLPAALALEAAGAQGKFWEYQQILLSQQTSWSAVSEPQELFLTYAKQTPLDDLERFRRDITGEIYKGEILSDLAFGNRLKPKETPFFLVNGEETSLAGLKLSVERLLSKP